MSRRFCKRVKIAPSVRVIVMAAALGLALQAPMTRADEAEDLQEQIDALRSQLDQLQADREAAEIDRQYHCGEITGWAKGWYGRHGHKKGH
jgi:outer membrane murein-binding lipoprotein Lpp